MSQISHSVDEIELSLCQENLEVDLHFQPSRRAIHFYTGSRGTWR